MKKYEIIKRALQLFLDPESVSFFRKEPRFEDGYLCSTDGHSLICIKTNTSVPGTKAGKPVIYDHMLVTWAEDRKYLGNLTRDWILLNALQEGKAVTIGSVTLPWKRYQTILDAILFLGLDYLMVYECGFRAERCLMFRTYNPELDVKDSVIILSMGIAEKRGAQVLTLPSDAECAVTSSSGINVKEGSAYISNYDAVMARRAAELKAARKGNLWEVRVAKYASFYVEAVDKKEADTIARKVYSEVDNDIFFGSDVEYEEVLSNKDPDDVLDYDDVQIYTTEGWMDDREYEEYLDKD